jgi:hypothetical protein
VSISGSLTAAACISYPSLPDPKFATDRLPFLRKLGMAPEQLAAIKFDVKVPN